MACAAGEMVLGTGSVSAVRSVILGVSAGRAGKDPRLSEKCGMSRAMGVRNSERSGVEMM